MIKREFVYQKSYYEPKKGEVKKILLLYSGGFSTTALLKWLQKAYKAEVTTLTLNLGQQQMDMENFKQKALKHGAKKALVINAQDEFVERFVAKAIKANSGYQGTFHISVSLSRSLLAEYAIKIAQQEGIECIAHGAGSLSIDQIRIESLLLTMNPDIKIISPKREQFPTRAKLIKYAEDIDPSIISDHAMYTYDNNLWGISVVGVNSDIGQMDKEPDIKTVFSKVLPEEIVEKGENITITFEKGLPIKLNGVEMPLAQIINETNKIGARNKVGMIFNVQYYISGLKSRSLFFAPGSEIIVKAHQELEKLITTKIQHEHKKYVDDKWSQLVYEGLALEPLIENLEAYIESANKDITGEVTLKLDHGTVLVVSMTTVQTKEDETLINYIHSLENYQTQAVPGYVQLHSSPMLLARQAPHSILLSIGKRSNKFSLLHEVKKIAALNYKIYATYKTYKFLRSHNILATRIHKVSQIKLKPNVKDLVSAGRFDAIIAIPTNKVAKASKKEVADMQYIKDSAVKYNTPIFSTVEETKDFVNKLTTQ